MASASRRKIPLRDPIREEPSPCPADGDIVAFAEGRLDPNELDGFHLHVDECECCQQLVMEAVCASGLAATNPVESELHPAWNTTFRRGEHVAQRYRIERFIARGGMGEVYEAFDYSMQERVALKTVTSTACDSVRAVQRLIAEVQLARRVSHPNVCRIYDIGSHQLADGVTRIHFLSMEFVEGQTLGQRLRKDGALEFELAVDLARQLLQGLHAAHSAGILHRDFKSDNVMLRSDAEGKTTAVVLDFGLARAVDDSTRASGSGHVVGTLGYIAPEQLHGRPTVASDVYSFGVVFFEMLTGMRPFEAASGGEFAPSSHMLLPSRVNPALPAGIDRVVSGCLRPSAAQRFKSASAVLEKLSAVDQRATGTRGRRTSLGSLVALCALGATLTIAVEHVRRPARTPDVSSATPESAAQPRRDPEPSAAPVPAPPASDLPASDSVSARPTMPSSVVSATPVKKPPLQQKPASSSRTSENEVAENPAASVASAAGAKPATSAAPSSKFLNPFKNATTGEAAPSVSAPGDR